MVVRGMILAKAFPVTKALVPMAINQDLKAVRPTSEWDIDYFAQVLRASAPETFRRLDEAGHGTKALRMDAWLGVELPRPPVQEQIAIAGFLERETAKIDALVSEQARLIELLKEKRQAVISHAITKGLNPDAPMKDSGIEWLGQVPAHWAVTKMKHLASSIEQGWSPQCEGFAADPDSTWCVLKVGCVNGGVFNPDANKALPPDLEPVEELVMRADDLLVSRANTRDLVGSAAVVERDYPRLILSDKLYRIRFADDRTLPRFVAGLLAMPVVRSRIELEATGASSSMLNITQRAILELAVSLPPGRERAQILVYLSDTVGRLDKLIAEAERAITLLQERRAALIAAAATGQIDVRSAAARSAA